MSESKDVWDDDEEFWNFVGENKQMIGLAISNGQGLDILNALRDIYLTIDKEPKSAMRMITLLGTVIYASSIDKGKEFTDEIQVIAAMEQFESSIKEILDEEPK